MKIPKIKLFEIQRFKAIDGKEPEVFISREQISEWYDNMKKDKDISGIVPYLKEVKTK